MRRAACSAMGSRFMAGRYQLQSSTLTEREPRFALSHAALTVVVRFSSSAEEDMMPLGRAADAVTVTTAVAEDVRVGE